MNVRLQYDLEFLAGIYYQDSLQINSYDVSINMLTKTKDPASTNIAMDRVKAFVYGMLENTVFINQANMERAEFLQMIGCNVTTLPEEPVDQIIGMMLYYKLNAIMEDRMVITNLDISSKLGDGVWYQHDEEDVAGPFSPEGWWHKSSTQHDTIETEEVDDNVVKVISTGWYEMDLEWPENSAPPTANTVVYANFPKK
jgi:hypothetical protein